MRDFPRSGNDAILSNLLDNVFFFCVKPKLQYKPHKVRFSSETEVISLSPPSSLCTCNIGSNGIKTESRSSFSKSSRNAAHLLAVSIIACAAGGHWLIRDINKRANSSGSNTSISYRSSNTWQYFPTSSVLGWKNFTIAFVSFCISATVTGVALRPATTILSTISLISRELTKSLRSFVFVGGGVVSCIFITDLKYLTTSASRIHVTILLAQKGTRNVRKSVI